MLLPDKTLIPPDRPAGIDSRVKYPRIIRAYAPEHHALTNIPVKN